MAATRSKIKKKQLVKQILADLSETFETLNRAATASRAEATHESSKAESKYDTRGLEAGYLASGQAFKAMELLECINAYESLDLRDFKAGDPIGIGAVVDVEVNGDRLLYFVGPKRGGMEIKYQRKEITVITPQSPLGQNLVGRKKGENWIANVGGLNSRIRVVSIQ